MKVAFFLNIVSPHQLPLAQEVVRRVGENNFTYVFAESFHAERARMGWSDKNLPDWCVKGNEDASALMEADIVYTGLRCLNLIRKRSSLGKKTFYSSERWFKPPIGFWRLLSPSYFKLAKSMAALLCHDPYFKYLAIGPWSVKDMALLCRIFHPLCSRHKALSTKIIPWGYFVAPSSSPRPHPKRSTPNAPLRVLCVGRLLKLKHFETVIRAVACANKKMAIPAVKLNHEPQHACTLTILGDGPEESHLKKLANSIVRLGSSPSPISFFHSIPITEVREFMRSHDVLVFSSNGYDGWGAVVSEALEEGLCVLGTCEAGASSAMLPKACLFHCGDWRRLAKLLVSDIPRVPIGAWSVEAAAERLLAL